MDPEGNFGLGSNPNQNVINLCGKPHTPTHITDPSIGYEAYQLENNLDFPNSSNEAADIDEASTQLVVRPAHRVSVVYPKFHEIYDPTQPLPPIKRPLNSQIFSNHSEALPELPDLRYETDTSVSSHDNDHENEEDHAEERFMAEIEDQNGESVQVETDYETGDEGEEYKQPASQDADDEDEDEDDNGDDGDDDENAEENDDEEEDDFVTSRRGGPLPSLPPAKRRKFDTELSISNTPNSRGQLKISPPSYSLTNFKINTLVIATAAKQTKFTNKTDREFTVSDVHDGLRSGADET